MASSEDRSSSVDETPISPSRPNPARKNSLEFHLSHRPNRQELIDKTLLKEGVLHEDPRSPEDKYLEAIEAEYAKREGGA
ncbi:hypothetical protein VTJ49DRAFT_3307 [Mycothermus thermophilus]|uniref:Uncharacterized protein n=1 Tax=Humicola insolens TaxID=85995 RepID=A0ABR3V7X4_HUMIN